MELKGKSAIVTGASSGIGRETAILLARSGMNVLITARRAERLEELASEIGADCHWLAGDILQPALPARLIGQAVSRFGRCDVVVNNAGILETGPCDTVDLDRICRMVRVNVEAAYRVIFESIRHFRASGGGHVVNISSVLGTKTRPTAGAYAGTKHAIEALSEALRMELSGTPVQVSCVQPGLVMTELHDHMPVHPKEALQVDHPLTPADVARAVRYVLEQPEHLRVPRVMVLPADNQI